MWCSIETIPRTDVRQLQAVPGPRHVHVSVSLGRKGTGWTHVMASTRACRVLIVIGQFPQVDIDCRAIGYADWYEHNPVAIPWD